MKTPSNFNDFKRHSGAKLRLKPDVQHMLQQELSKFGSNDEPFYIVSVDAIVNQFNRWQQLMPRVHPFYAVKCNPTPVVLRTLATLGCNFDCASKGEIDQVMSLGISADRIIYANPCKTRSYIDHARRVGVDLMTFDNEPELHKIASIFPSARVVLRIKVDDSHSVCRFSAKFGAHMSDTLHLLQVARSLGLQVVGVSFHVGSGCESLDSFVSAIEDAKLVFEYGQSLGFNMQLLDLGGGYPGTSDAKIPFEPIAATIQSALDRLFPPIEGLQIIAEPGRYFAAGAFTLVTQVIAKREIIYNDEEQAEAVEFAQNNSIVRCPAQKINANLSQAQVQDDANSHELDMNREMMYYLNDGVYGSFNCTIFDHWTVYPAPWLPAARCSSFTPYTRTILWGPTCDSMDLIRRDIFMPELQIGDWIVFNEMGAYTIAAASAFNGFQLPTLKYQLSGRVMAELKATSDWPYLKQLLTNRSAIQSDNNQRRATNENQSQFNANPISLLTDENRLLPTPPDTEPGDRVEPCLINGEISYIRVH